MNQTEYLQLVKEVNRLRNETHLFNTEEISDIALDNLKHQISLYESTHPESVSPDSPNYFVAGGVLDGFTKAKHTRRMLSINDVFDLTEIIDWEKRWKDYLFSIRNEYPERVASHRLKLDTADTDLFSSDQGITIQKNIFSDSIQTEYICEPKLDGISISLCYRDGKLIRGVTRGDGYIGEDVTANVLFIQSIPQTIADTRTLEVRGEIFFSKSEFNELNERISQGLVAGRMGKTGPEYTFANPRNAAAGSLRNLDTSVVESRNLEFIAYGCFIEDGAPDNHTIEP